MNLFVKHGKHVGILNIAGFSKEVMIQADTEERVTLIENLIAGFNSCENLRKLCRIFSIRSNRSSGLKDTSLEE